MAEWHYTEEEKPEKPGFYQVAVEAYVTLDNIYVISDGNGHMIRLMENIPAVCYWNGGEWDRTLSLETDITCGGMGAIEKTDTIYAWADVLLSAPKVMYPGNPVTINPADYHLTEGQLKNFLRDYKTAYEKGII